MTSQSILKELRPLGKESYKRVLVKNHGIREPCFGVPISELKKFQKRIRKDYRLALELYESCNYDAMYLAGLIADDAQMTREDLQRWVDKAYGGALAGYIVPSVAAGSPNGKIMAFRWIESDQDLVSAAGWATLSAIVSVTPDAQLDMSELEKLLERVSKTIHESPNLTRYHMNNFVIAVGCFVAPLTETALRTAKMIGRVTADLGNNDCKIPDAQGYVEKVRMRGTIGKKRKSAKC